MGDGVRRGTGIRGEEGDSSLQVAMALGVTWPSPKLQIRSGGAGTYLSMMTQAVGTQ